MATGRVRAILASSIVGNDAPRLFRNVPRLFRNAPQPLRRALLRSVLAGNVASDTFLARRGKLDANELSSSMDAITRRV